MVLPFVPRREVKNGNGLTQSFDFSFRINQASDLVVTHVAADGTETLLTEGTGPNNYSVNVTVYPNSGSILYPATLGTLLPSGEQLVLERTVTMAQTTRLRNQGDWRPETVEDAFDFLMMALQQHDDQLSRSITSGITVNSSDVDFTLPFPSSDAVIGVWNNDASAIVTGPTTTEISNAEANANIASAAASTATSAKNDAEAARDEAQAAVGGVRVSANDTTADNLEAKILASGLVGLSTQNEGGNETRTVDVPIATQAEAEGGLNNTKAVTPLRAAQMLSGLRPAASQAEMEAGTQTALRGMSPAGVKQAINALAPAGTIIQVVQTHLTTTSSQVLSAGIRANISGLNATITPRDANSRIHVSVRWSGEVSTTENFDIVFGIRRGTTDIGNPDPAGARPFGIAVLAQGYWDPEANSTPDSVSYEYTDSPGTASPVTYHATIQSKTAQTLYNQRTVLDSDSSAYERITSTIILKEIAG